MPFTAVRRVEFCDTDMAGIAHFANFYRYMEQAEHELRRSLGMDIYERRPDGTVLSWPRVSASCSFHAPARHDDVLEIEVAVAKLGEKSVTFSFHIRRGETAVATGEMKSVCCVIRPGQPLESIDIPESIRGKLEAMTAEC
ncbi:MAG: acyl-CoA thioesterase [Planctomycetes bacterium]|nr:acyl-CoA thioesterase [Planctomycetota bacterium]